VTHLKKYFDVPAGHLHAVDDVSFSIKRGETLGVVGESGCGKSTLGRVLLGLHPATSGDIIFEGMDLSTFSKQEMIPIRREMQIIFQDPYASLNPRFTVAQIIEEPLRLHKVCKNAEERRKRVEELMEMVGLPRRAYNLYPHEFDGGRRQRIVIARALAINPQFVVCDEPVSALDVSVQAQILNLMIDLQKQLGLTYLFISHDLSVVKHISDNVVVMYLGQVIEKAPKQALFQTPMHPYTTALLSAIPSVNVREKRQRIILKGELSSPINPGDGCRFAKRCPFAQPECFTRTPEYREMEPEHFVACHRAEEVREGKLKYQTI
jgi:oligopeptide/dipeptide ABC transporter, ATP-binding protein, C-terminal domain